MSQRIALLADIHANLIAFEAALADARAQGIERFICLGDVAEGGPMPREVLALLRSLGGVCIMGNTDERLLHPNDQRVGLPELAKHDDIEDWDRAMLTDTDRDFMATFAPTHELELAPGLNLLCYHGSPRDNRELIKADTDWGRLDAAFSGQPATWCAGGHTHEQMILPFRDKVVFNPGSVGMPFIYLSHGTPDAAPRIRSKPVRAEYAILSVEQNEVNLTLRRVPYPFQELAEATRASGMPHTEWWLADWDSPAG